MELYDRLECHGPEFVCSEGHDLSSEEFQTKALGQTMGYGTIKNGVLTFEDGGYGHDGYRVIAIDRLKSAAIPKRDSPLVLYCGCTQCPALMPPARGHIEAAWHPLVEFAVVMEDDRVVSVTRTSQTSAEWQAEMLALPPMIDAKVMSTADAVSEWTRRDELSRQRFGGA